jgi:hypothetical protein
MSFSIVFEKCILILSILFSMDLQAWQASKKRKKFRASLFYKKNLKMFFLFKI